MFKIIKKGSGNFWHNFNNGSKEVNLSDWEIVLDSVSQTVSLQMLNGANVPNNSVIISDVVVNDETDGSIEETFGSVSILRTRLIELNYTPYIVLNGFVPEAPIDGLTYGRKDAEWVEVSGGGSVGTLQQVTDNGNTTTNDITAGGFLSLGNANIPGINFNDAEDLDTSLGFLGADPSITTPRNWVLPDASGTIALTSEIPPSITIDATPTDGSSNAVSSNGVFDGLALKQDTLTETNFGAFINARTAKNTLVDTDEVLSDDSADSNKAKKTTWLNVWDNYIKPKVTALISSATSNTVNKLIIATPSSNINSTSQTIVYSQLIPANTLPSSCVLDIDYRLVKTGVAGSWPSSIYINTSNSLSGATVISTVAPSQSALIIRLQRTFNIHSGTLKGVIAIGYSDASTSTVAESSTSINVANDIYILVSVLPGSAVDTINGRHLRISW